MQTDDEVQEDIQLYEDDSPELAAFLRRIEPHVYKELQKNRRSHAFDGQWCAAVLVCIAVAEYSRSQKSGVSFGKVREIRGSRGKFGD